MLTANGKKMFRQYDKSDKHAFAKFLKVAVHRFKKIFMIMNYVLQYKA